MGKLTRVWVSNPSCESGRVFLSSLFGFGSGGNSHSVASFWALVFSMNILGLKLDCFWAMWQEPLPPCSRLKSLLIGRTSKGKEPATYHHIEITRLHIHISMWYCHVYTCMYIHLTIIYHLHIYIYISNYIHICIVYIHICAYMFWSPMGYHLFGSRCPGGARTLQSLRQLGAAGPGSGSPAPILGDCGRWSTWGFYHQHPSMVDPI